MERKVATVLFADVVDSTSLVIGTDPGDGTTVDAGTTVTLIVSNAVRVPSVVGQSVSTARADLDRETDDESMRVRAFEGDEINTGLPR